MHKSQEGTKCENMLWIWQWSNENYVFQTQNKNEGQLQD
jgi:hypothetical protein